MPLDIDRFAHIGSPLQRWDPRFKIFSLGLFVLGVALIKTIPLSAIALMFALLLVWLAGLPAHFVGGGVKWVILFLLPFFIIMPLSYPGEDAIRLAGLPFAWEGLRLAVLIVIKAVAIVLTAYSIFGSSRFDVSMLALQRLKCPKIIVQMLLFTYRYVFVFLAEMQRMETAMRARGFIKRTDLRTLRVIGNFIGTLLIRSFERTERIYKAMLSKGYQGEFHSLTTFKSVGNDWVKASLIIVLVLLLIGVDVMGTFHPAAQAWY
jgi:cobalt/nickel transport system permease protein